MSKVTMYKGGLSCTVEEDKCKVMTQDGWSVEKTTAQKPASQKPATLKVSSSKKAESTEGSDTKDK